MRHRLGLKRKRALYEMSRLNWDDAMMVTGLQKRTDLNHHAARVLADHPREDGRIPIEMFIGQERIWIKRDNLLGPIHNERALSNPRYKDMPETDRDDVTLFLRCNEHSTRIPGLPGRVISLKDKPAADPTVQDEEQIVKDFAEKGITPYHIDPSEFRNMQDRVAARQRQAASDPAPFQEHIYRAAVRGVRRVMELNGTATHLIDTLETGMLAVVKRPGKEEKNIRQLCEDYRAFGMNDVLVGALIHATKTAKDEDEAELAVMDHVVRQRMA